MRATALGYAIVIGLLLPGCLAPGPARQAPSRRRWVRPAPPPPPPPGPARIPVQPMPGRMLAFVRVDERSGGQDVYLVPAGARAAIRLTDRNRTSQLDPVLFGLRFSPDGAALVFAAMSDVPGSGRLWICDVRTRRVRPLTPARSGPGPAEWLPDGRVLTGSTSDPDQRFLIADPRTGSVRHVDGMRLPRRRPHGPLEDLDALGMARAAARSRNVARAIAGDVEMGWLSPDGRYLVGTERTSARDSEGNEVGFFGENHVVELNTRTGATSRRLAVADGIDHGGDGYQPVSWWDHAHTILLTSPPDDGRLYLWRAGQEAVGPVVWSGVRTQDADWWPKR